MTDKSKPTASPLHEAATGGTQNYSRANASYEMVLGVALFAVVGLGIDAKLDTRPWFTMGATLFAIVGSGLSVYYRYRHDMQAEAAKRGRRDG